MRLRELLLAVAAFTGARAAPAPAQGRGGSTLDNFICDAALDILSAAAQPSQIAAASSYCSSLIRPTVKAVTTTTPPTATFTETTSTDYIATSDGLVRRSPRPSGSPPPAWQHYLSQDLSSICTCLLTSALPKPTTVYTSTQTMAQATVTVAPQATEFVAPLYFTLQVNDANGNQVAIVPGSAGPVFELDGQLEPYSNAVPLQFTIDAATLGQPGIDIVVQDTYSSGYPFLAAEYATSRGTDTSDALTYSGGTDSYTSNWAILTLATTSIGANHPASSSGTTLLQSNGLGDNYGNYETTIWQVSNDGKYSLSGVWTNPDGTTVDVKFFWQYGGFLGIIGDVTTLAAAPTMINTAEEVFLNFVPVYE